MRQYLATILLILTLPMGEAHTYWHGDQRIENWIRTVQRPMLMEWNVKSAAEQFIIIVYFLGWVFYKPNRVNHTTVVAFFFLSILDTILYFYNYKTGDFGSVYFWFVGLWLIIYYVKWKR